MLTASLMFRQQVLLKIARFLAGSHWGESTGGGSELDRTIEDACTYINEQQERLRRVTMRRDLLSIEVEHLEDEVKWLKAVMDAAGIDLQQYDYLRRKRT